MSNNPIDHVWLDNGYTGPTVHRPATALGSRRTNGWIDHCRRLDRHYETTLTTHQGFLTLSQIALLLRRLERSQLFDTL